MKLCCTIEQCYKLAFSLVVDDTDYFLTVKYVIIVLNKKFYANSPNIIRGCSLCLASKRYACVLELKFNHTQKAMNKAFHLKCKYYSKNNKHIQLMMMMMITYFV